MYNEPSYIDQVRWCERMEIRSVFVFCLFDCVTFEINVGIQLNELNEKNER